MGMIIFDHHGYGGCQRPKTLQQALFGTLTHCLAHPAALYLEFQNKTKGLGFQSYQYFYWQSVLKQTASRPNHTSYRKFDFECVQISLCCNRGMIIFDLRGYGGCQRPKTLYLAAHLGLMFGSSHSASSTYQRFTKK